MEANKTYKDKWFIMAAVAMGVFLATIDSSIVNVALPTMVKELSTTFAIVEWIVLVYLLTISILMLSVGRIADIVGKKKLYLAGFLVFLTGSLLCGTATHIYALIGYRVIQAIGAAFMMVLGTAIVTEGFPPTERGMALGFIGTVVSAGVITGPTLGGIILHYLKWNWIFFVNLPVGVVGILLVQKYVPDIVPNLKQHFDITGAVIMFLGLGSFLFSLSFGQMYGFTQPAVIILFIVFIAMLILFIRFERKTREPMLDLALFKNTQFSVNVFTGFLTFVANSGNFFLMPFYFTNVLHLSSGKIGLLMGIIPGVMSFTAPISGKLSDRLGTRVISLCGLVFLFIGIFSLTTLDVMTTIPQYIIRAIPIGLGLGLFQSPNNSAIMGAAPKNRLGIAAGMMSLTRTLGQTTGIALTGALWAARITYYLGEFPAGGASAAPAQVQANSLHDVLLISSAVIILALVVAGFAYRFERKTLNRTTYQES